MSSPKMGRAPKPYGGQAVIEGVMMRGQHHFAVACRKPNGEIVIREEKVPAFFTRYAWARWPFIRGTFALADSLVLGIKALMYSAELATEAEAEAEDAGPGSRESAGDTGRPTARSGVKSPVSGPITSIAISFSAFAGLGIGLALFVLLPSWIVGFLAPLLPNETLLNLVEGVLRLGLFLGYVTLVARMEHVQRVFRYHGAEHMAINGFEETGQVDLETAMRQPTIHPRCGTNFVLVVLILKTFVAMFFGWPVWWLRLILRVALLPVVAGLAYETIRLAGKYRDVRPLQWLVAPGLWTQRLTTREPSRDMVEVAVAALESVVRREEPAIANAGPEAERRAAAAETL